MGKNFINHNKQMSSIHFLKFYHLQHDIDSRPWQHLHDAITTTTTARQIYEEARDAEMTGMERVWELETTCLEFEVSFLLLFSIICFTN